MIKVLELFGGIGACSKALEKLSIEYEIADYVEIDKYAVQSFNAMHGTDFKPQDVKEWNKDIDVDLIMHGSPCQDFSIAGKQAGGDKDSGTRSSLMYETLRIVEKLKPKYVVWENVKNILSKKHYHNFLDYFDSINKLGYVTFYEVLNAKDYGIPQNRERVFTISIRNDVYVDTIDAKNKRFYFPEPFPLEKKLKDFLEDNVDEKYYISNRQLHGMIVTNYTSYKLSALLRDKDDIANTIKARFKGNPQLVEDEKLRIKTNNKKGFDEAELYDSINIQFPSSKTRRGRVGHQVAQTLQTSDNMAVVEPRKNYQIRKLTPKECWRLMGFEDSDFELARAAGVSNTQLYKQAGNSIVVDVLVEIFKILLEDYLW